MHQYLFLAKLRSGFGWNKICRVLPDCVMPQSDVSGTADEPCQCMLYNSFGSLKKTEEKEEVEKVILLAFIDISLPPMIGHFYLV